MGGVIQMKIAIFTIVKDEKIMLPKWINYYKKQCDKLLILDNDTTDGSTDNIEYEVRKVTCGKAFNHDWLKNIVMKTQKELLKTYDYVVFAEVDEFIMHKNKPLKQAILEANLDKIRCEGYNIIQLENEKDLDWDKPLLEQRSNWSRFTQMDKTLISKNPLEWVVGFHHAKGETTINKGWYLIHLHTIDKEYAWNKTLLRSKYDWNKKDKDKGLGQHNHISNKEIFNKWYNIFKDTGKIIPELRGKL